MGTWSNNTHVSFENIEKLWKLVDVRLSHEIAKGKFPRVVFCGLYGIGIFVDVHGTEFDALKRLAIETRSCLFEKYRTRTLNLDDKCYDRQEW